VNQELTLEVILTLSKVVAVAALENLAAQMALDLVGMD
jgi:hypothetical protein